jgi:hypothetical protein
MGAQEQTSQRQWPNRIDPLKIRRLYESDARGMLDRELLDDVGYGLYVRCQAILEAAEAWQGRVQCWNCDNTIPRRQGKVVNYRGHGPTRTGGDEEQLVCEQCGWQITWASYRKSLSGQAMGGTGREDALHTFVERWPAARTPQAKLLQIDALIHAFHCWDGTTIGSLVGASVIRATAEQVMALLDELAYGPQSTPGTQDTRQRWMARVEAKRAQRPMSELRALARELGIKGRSRMGRAELEAALRQARALSAVGSYSSGRSDISLNHDAYLDEAYSQ